MPQLYLQGVQILQMHRQGYVSALPVREEKTSLVWNLSYVARASDGVIVYVVYQQILTWAWPWDVIWLHSKQIYFLILDSSL